MKKCIQIGYIFSYISNILMVSMIFAPLHIVSGYSFLQSGLTSERISKSIKDNDYFGAAIADKEVMYGVTSFIKGMGS